MSEDKLSQNDIDALIAKMTGGGAASNNQKTHEKLGISEIELNGLKKLFEISINSSCEVLKNITQKEITVETIGEIKTAGSKEISGLIEPPYIATKVDYTIGLRGLELLLIKQSDLGQLIKYQFETMGFGSDTEIDDEFMLSGSQEFMNQMLGHTAAKVGEALDMFIDISTPTALNITDTDSAIDGLKEDEDSYIYTTFKLNVNGQLTGDLIKVLDKDFLNELCDIMNKGSFLDEWREDTNNGMQVDEEDDDEVEEIPNGNTYDNNEDDIQVGQNLRMNAPQHNYNTNVNIPKSSNIQSGENINFTKFQLPDLHEPQFKPPTTGMMSRVNDVKVQLSVELGRSDMLIRDIIELGKGSIVELDRLAGEHLDLYVNGTTLIAKGEVIILKDHFAFRILSIVDQDYRQ